MKINKGQSVLEYFSININEAIITVILLIFSIILGKKFKHHIFAKLGSTLSTVLLSLFILIFIIDIIQQLI